MRIYILLPIFLLTYFESQGQVSFTNKSCDTLELSPHARKIIKVNQTTLKDYIIEHKLNNKNDSIYLEEKEGLHSLKTWVCNPREIELYEQIGSTKIGVSIRKHQIPFSSEEYVMPNTYEGAKMLLYNDQNTPFGFIQSDSSASVISSLKATYNEKEIVIPDSAFNDLLFPNFCNVAFPIRPVEAYLSSDGSLIYLYIHGENRSNKSLSYQEGTRYSYLAKLIISLEDGYLTRVVLRGTELCYYNWETCLNFTGF